MKKILKNSLMFMLVIFALFIGVNSANITASAASDDELFKAYVKSNFKVLASSKVTDKNATGILCYFIKDLDSDKSKEMILFERKTNGILMYLYEIEGGKVVSKGSADRIISGTGAGNYATTTCAYLDGNTIRIDSDCINYGGSSSMSFYVAYTVKNNKLNKVSHFEASEFPRYGSSVYKNAVTNKSYSGSSEYKKAVKSAGFDIDGHVHLGKNFDVSKDNPQTAKCYKGKHLFAYVNSVNLLKTGNYGFVVDNTANLNSSSTTTTTTAPAKVTGLKATSTTSALKLSWKKVSGATGYRVYKKASDGWKKLADVTSTSYTIKNLKAGNKLTLRVRAFTKKNGKTTYGSYSSSFVTATKPATPTLKVTSTAAGKATLTWKNVSGESGYQIYYSTKKDSGYKKLTTVKANTAKYTASKLTSGKTYYFRVRAYIKLSSGNVYGGYKTVSVKVKAAATKLTNAKVAELWKKANDIHNQWYMHRQYKGYVDTSRSIKLNGNTYYPVKHSTITSRAALKKYLSNYFDEAICKKVMGPYIDYNGKLYAAQLAMGGDFSNFVSLSVKSQSGNNAQLSIVFNDYQMNEKYTIVQKMKYVNNKWIFTEQFAFDC